MNIKELKNLIDQELKRKKIQEATVAGTPKAKLKAASEEPTQAIPGIAGTEPGAKTILKPKTAPQQASSGMQSPEDFYKGILRLHNALRDKLELELKNEEAYEIVREITSQEIEKLRAKFPELDIGSKLG